MKLAITVQEGTLAGRRADFIEGFLTVGRDPNCNLRFDPQVDKVVSSKHAYVEQKPDGFYLVDNKSTNGTFLNGAQVTERSILRDGDTIQFGKNGPTAVVSIQNGQAGAPQNQFDADAPPPTQFAPAAAAPVFQPSQPAEPSFQPGASQSLRNSFSNFGLKNPEEKPVAQPRNYVGAGVALLGVVFLSLIVMLLMITSVGPVTAVIAAVVAFTPAMFYLLPLIWLDRYDPEPFWLLGLAFAWGALVAVLVSFVVNTAVGIVVASAVDPQVGQLASAVISAPIFEEGSKGIGLVLLLIFFRRYFDDILDGIIFAGVIALGFATVENVLYYGRGINQGGAGGLMILFVLRGVLSPFAHVSFTAMTGIGCGIARESHNKIIRLVMPVMGYGGAVFLHALWNGMASLGGLDTFLIGYLILEVPFFLIFVGFALYIMYRQNKILKEMLAIDVARGLISEEQLKTTTSAFRSSAWVLGGLFNGKFRPRSRFLRAVGKLGLSYWHIQRATAAQGHTGSFQQNPVLREEVLEWRDKI